MTWLELKAECIAALADGQPVVLERKGKLPRSFPRGELLCENSQGGRVFRYKPERLLAWLAKHPE